MSLIVDINPVPWEILEQVKARLLRNRANRQKRQPEKGKELRRVMQVDNGILAKQRWEEPSFVGGDTVKSITIEYIWQSGRDLDTVTSMTEPVIDGPLGYAVSGNAKYISWTGDDTSGSGTEVITLGRPKSKETSIAEDKKIETFLADYPDIDIVKFSLAANWYRSVGNEIVIKVKINLDEPDEQTIFEEAKAVTLLQEGGPGQNLGILEVSLDGEYAKLT